MNALTPPGPAHQGSPIEAILLRHLAQICEALDLPPERFKQAKERYESLGRFLCEPTNPLSKLKPNIYSQGSTRLHTTVKPPQGEEFDIDLICELAATTAQSPEDIFNQVKVAIESNRNYAKMISVKNRCIRITYANEFYLDVTPGIPDVRFGPENIRVTDCPTKSWKASNPKDYAEWFATIASVPPQIHSFTAKTADFDAHLETRASVEPVTTPKAMRPVLNRFVQIFKRHRDIRYLDDRKHAPISAVITTLAARAYASLATVSHDNLYALLLAIARALPAHLGPYQTIQGKVIYSVPNPKNPEENYADKWKSKPERQDEFFKWQAALVKYLEELQILGGTGGDVLHRKLADGFGDGLVTRLAVEKAQRLKDAAAKGAIGITTTGLIVSKAAAVAPVRRQTFHN